MRPDMIATFITEYHCEYNRLVSEENASRAPKERELAQVLRKIDQMIEAITEGMFHPSMKDMMAELEARKARLIAELADQPIEEPIRLHPGLPDTLPQWITCVRCGTLGVPIGSAEMLFFDWRDIGEYVSIRSGIFYEDDPIVDRGTCKLVN